MNFSAIKPIFRICLDKGLHSSGPMLLLTPILTYLYMLNVICRLCHLCQKCHKWHIRHAFYTTYDIHKYVNMGVKRSVRTSGMQLFKVKYLKNWFYCLKIRNFDDCIFGNFLCIFKMAGTLPIFQKKSWYFLCGFLIAIARPT